MILEVALLKVRPGTINDFESDFRKASKILMNIRGYRHHELHKCIEQEHQYIMLVRWNSITEHIVGFKQSELYQEWCSLLEPYYDAAPSSEHYISIKLPQQEQQLDSLI